MPMAEYVIAVSQLQDDAPRNSVQPALRSARGECRPRFVVRYGWWVAYPRDWQLDAANPSNVRIRAGAELQGLISFADQHKSLTFISKRSMTLPNGIEALEVVDEIASNGHSREIDVRIGEHVFVDIDAESYSEAWPAVESPFSRIIYSFTIRR